MKKNYICTDIIEKKLKRKFVTNLAFLLFLNLLIKPFYVLGIDVGIQNAVPASYGIYFPLLSLSLMFQVLLDMGIENFTRREIARHHNLLPKYLSNIIALKLMLAMFYFIVCLLIAVLSDFSWYEIQLLLILLFNQFLASMILYFRANIGGLQLFKTESIISVLDKTLLIIICGSLLWGHITSNPFKIEWFIYAQTFSYTFTLAVSFLIVLGKAGKIKLNFDLQNNLFIIRRSLPYALLMLLMASYLRIDSVLLKQLLPNGNIQAGIYAHSFRFLEMMQNYGYLFAIILLPMFAKMLKNRESVEQLVQMASIIIVVPAIIVSVASIFFRTEIIHLFYSEHLNLSAKVFGIIMPGFLGMCSTYIFGALLTANGNLKILIYIAGIGVIVSLIVNLLFIPLYGAVGSAMANLSAQFITALLQAAAATKVFKFKINYLLLLKFLIFTGIIVAFVFFIKKVNVIWIVQIGLFIVFSAVMAFLLKILEIKYFFQLIRSGNQIR